MMKREEKILIVTDNPLSAEAVELASNQLQLRSDFATDGWEIATGNIVIHE
jgi:hypothetical protein